MMNTPENPTPERIPDSSPDRPGWGWGLFLIFWAALISFLFLAPSEWSVSWLPWLRPAGHFHNLLAPYYFLAGSYAPSWNWLVPASFWGELMIGTVGLAFMTWVGRLFLNCFEIYLPRSAEWALCLVMGMGVCGVVYTFIAMAGLLTQGVTWGTLVVLIIALKGIAQLAEKPRLARAQDPESARVTRAAHREKHQAWLLRHMREEMAREWEEKTWFKPSGATALIERPLLWGMAILFTILTLLVFYHALFFPETYWDSLILYLGHARRIFLEHAFPNKVVLQVGVGLGANYPHLFELVGAVIATWANHWSPIYLQLASPLAGLAGLVLTYHTVLRLSRSVFVAATATLLLRTVPLLLIYHIYASNYSFAVLYAAAFFYCALRYIEDGLPGYFALMTASAAFSVHINYLMGALWFCWGVTILLAHWPRRPVAAPPTGAPWYWVEAPRVEEFTQPEFCRVRQWPSLGQLLLQPTFWIISLAGLATGAIWYIRNWVVTGNPLYAFFTGIFKGTKHFNPEVLASANLEWQSHGAGIADMGPTVWLRLLHSWSFFVNDYRGGNYCWRWAPSIVGLAFPGALLLILLALKPLRQKQGTGPDARPEFVWDTPTRFGLVALFFAAILFVYNYCLGPYYLYHLLPCFAVFGIFFYFALSVCPRPVVWLFGFWALFCALMPGLPMALMGQKITSSAAMQLIPLHNPGIGPDLFYEMRWGQTPRLWKRINQECKGSAILTHENRHLLFDPSIKLVHMDDWEVQQVWGKSSAERLETLKKLGVRYYLKVPFETDHPINARLGHAEWIADGTLEKIAEFPDENGVPHTLYRFHFPEAPEVSGENGEPHA